MTFAFCPLFCSGNTCHKTSAATTTVINIFYSCMWVRWLNYTAQYLLPECLEFDRVKLSNAAPRQTGVLELDFSSLARGSYIVTLCPPLNKQELSSENTPRTQECFINASAASILTGPRWTNRPSAAKL